MSVIFRDASSILPDQDDVCSICTEYFNEDRGVAHESPGWRSWLCLAPRYDTHRHHRVCLETWLNQNSICPLCRKDAHLEEARPEISLKDRFITPITNLLTLKVARNPNDYIGRLRNPVSKVALLVSICFLTTLVYSAACIPLASAITGQSIKAIAANYAYQLVPELFASLMVWINSFLYSGVLVFIAGSVGNDVDSKIGKIALGAFTLIGIFFINQTIAGLIPRLLSLPPRSSISLTNEIAHDFFVIFGICLFWRSLARSFIASD